MGVMNLCAGEDIARGVENAHSGLLLLWRNGLDCQHTWD